MLMSSTTKFEKGYFLTKVPPNRENWSTNRSVAH